VLTARRATPTMRPKIPTWGDDMAQSPSLDTLSKEFLRYLVAVRGYSVHTENNYRLAIGQFRAYLGETQQVPDTVASFTGEAVQAWITDLAERGVTRGTLVLKLSGLSSFADYLMKRHGHRNKPLLTHNPTKTFDWPTAEAPETEFMRPDELAAFLGVPLPLHEACVRDVLLDTGIRVSEACRATVGDLLEIDEGWSLAVIVKGRGTRRRKVHMPLAPATVNRLREALLARGIPSKDRDRDNAQPLLVNAQREAFTRSAMAGLVERIGTQAGITRFRLSPHKIRHTTNVLRDLAGVDDFTRARLLGQSSVRSQERYRHIVTGQFREAKAKQAEGLAAYLSRAQSISEAD